MIRHVVSTLLKAATIVLLLASGSALAERRDEGKSHGNAYAYGRESGTSNGNVSPRDTAVPDGR